MSNCWLICAQLILVLCLRLGFWDLFGLSGACHVLWLISLISFIEIILRNELLNGLKTKSKRTKRDDSLHM